MDSQVTEAEIVRTVGRAKRVPKRDTLREKGFSGFEGLWRSPTGSIYACDGWEFICVCVCSSQFRGWVNKVAVAHLRCVAGAWIGLQAFRNQVTGALDRWERIGLEVSPTTIIKQFPRHIPAEQLVYGYQERYTRISDREFRGQ